MAGGEGVWLCGVKRDGSQRGVVLKEDVGLKDHTNTFNTRNAGFCQGETFSRVFAPELNIHSLLLWSTLIEFSSPSLALQHMRKYLCCKN